jgi:regulator of protease activity HflC (stomatin/prohibitin superfamily)
MWRKLAFWAVGSLLCVAGILLVGAVLMIGPQNVWGLLRFDQRREGSLEVGDTAPDVELHAIDGVTKERLHTRIQGRPLVLIFGSYT